MSDLGRKLSHIRLDRKLSHIRLDRKISHVRLGMKLSPVRFRPETFSCLLLLYENTGMC